MRALFLSLALLATPLAAQTAAEVADARLAFIAGDYDTALAVLVPAAEAGNANAQNILGAAYEDGAGVPQDLAQAVAWYQRAADQGFPKALHNLGVFYGSETGETDYAQARTNYEAAVALGYAPSYANLGRLYELGLGAAADVAKANALYKEGIEVGDGWSAFNLGNNARMGLGMAEDLAQARVLYTRAIDLGLAQGYNALGLMTEEGMGGPQDALLAYVLYKEGVARGHGLAGVNLGFLVTETPGFWQDPVAGYGYCLWGIRNAQDSQREGFVLQCEGLVEYLSPEEETAAQLFSESLD